MLNIDGNLNPHSRVYRSILPNHKCLFWCVSGPIHTYFQTDCCHIYNTLIVLDYCMCMWDPIAHKSPVFHSLNSSFSWYEFLSPYMKITYFTQNACIDTASYTHSPKPNHVWFSFFALMSSSRFQIVKAFLHIINIQ